MRPAGLGVRAVAVIEALKGLLVLTVGAGLLHAFHHDAQHFAERLVGHLHLNPARHDPQVFVDALTSWDDSRLWWLAAMGAAYAFFRLAISWGLWFRRVWAEWLAIAAACIYVPFEVDALMHGITPLRAIMFAVNIGIVAVMAYALRSRRREEIPREETV